MFLANMNTDSTGNNRNVNKRLLKYFLTKVTLGLKEYTVHKYILHLSIEVKLKPLIYQIK